MDRPTYKSIVFSLFEKGEEITYPKNQIILHANETIEHVYAIVEGFVKIYTINGRGEEQLHVVYGPRDIFPLTTFIGDTVTNIFYQAMAECRLRRVRLDIVEARLLQDSRLSYAAFMQSIEQYKVYVSRVYSLEYRYARERLAHRLMVLAGRFGKQSEEGIVLLAPLTQQIIASSINLSRETVSREMERFVVKGYIKEISRSGAPLVITDPDGLCKEIPGGMLYKVDVL